MEIKTQLTTMVGDLLRDMDDAGWDFDFVEVITPEDCRVEGPWEHYVNDAFTVQYQDGTCDVFAGDNHVASYEIRDTSWECTVFKQGEWVDSVASVRGILLAKQYNWEDAKRLHADWVSALMGRIS